MNSFVRRYGRRLMIPSLAGRWLAYFAMAQAERYKFGRAREFYQGEQRGLARWAHRGWLSRVRGAPSPLEGLARAEARLASS